MRISSAICEMLIFRVELAKFDIELDLSCSIVCEIDLSSGLLRKIIAPVCRP